jgi:hypothetical protein
MMAIAGDFHGSAGIVAIIAAVFLTLLHNAVAGRMGALLWLGHKSPLSALADFGLFPRPLQLMPRCYASMAGFSSESLASSTAASNPSVSLADGIQFLGRNRKTATQRSKLA